MTITLTVAGRIATVDATTHVVAGNTYPVTLALDSEWTGNLYLRVRFGSLYYDIPFASSAASVDVQMPVGYPEVGIGVFSEALEICTCEARVRLLRSILEAGEQVVEFDSDLYDQWAGEVTTLLTDDAFDAESTRPVQNAVLTAWKDTVPLDSALVHKTGNESIAGNKTFLANIAVTGTVPTYKTESTLDFTQGATKGIYSMKAKNGSGQVVDYATASLLHTASGAGERMEMAVKVFSPSYAIQPTVSIRAMADGTSRVLVPSHLPTGSGGTHLAPDNTEAINSEMLAVDPRIVHTTGNESIAGNKTLSGTFSLDRADPTLNLKSTTTTAQTGVKANIVFYTNNTVRGQVFQQRDDSSEFIALRQQNLVGSGFSELRLRVNSSDVGWAEAPSYTADNSADAKIVTRSMLAQSPTVVHTTGAETIAGNKTFSGTVNVAKLRSASVAVQMTVNTWYKMYTITPTSVGQTIFLEIFNTSNISTMVDAKLRIQVPNASWPYDPAGNLFNVGSALVGKLAKTADGKLEVWLCKVSGSTQYIMLNAEYLDILIPTPVGTSGDEPVQGDDYPLVKNITVVS